MDAVKMLWTADEMAFALGISKRKAYEMMERREVPGVVKLGKLIRVEIDAIQGWIKEKSGQSEGQQIGQQIHVN